MSQADPDGLYTTNEEDQKEVAKLKARLTEANESSSANHQHQRQNPPPSTATIVPSVSLDDGAHKYVLIKAEEPGSGLLQHFVISRRGAGYHQNVAEPTVYTLERHGYRAIEIAGGGRILLDEDEKKISIFGFSYGFGQADHAISKKVIEADERFHGFDITTSNEGY
jgi:phosphohistidine phosphatase